MKFGKNLAHLSIPEWKVYNLDYNDLKAAIRDVTHNGNLDLSTLYRKFCDNFDYLTLFVGTKLGELARKLKASLKEFTRISNNEYDSPAIKLAKLSLLHYLIINDISSDLRKLTKFILVQKIAVKKIFKKFAKHYPDPKQSKVFLTSLSNVLLSNPSSFVNFDLSFITAKLLVLLEDLDRELKMLHELLHRKFVFHPLPHGNLRKSHSITTIKTAQSSLASATSSPDNVYLDTHVDTSIEQTAKFDLISNFKKNFLLVALMPKDIISRNDLSLSMDVYLNIPKLSDASRVCLTYLSASIDDETPSYVISYENLSISVVVAHTGGLRQYSYCSLPNSIIESIFHITNTDNPALKQELVALLVGLIDITQLPAMAKLTINSLVESKQAPSLKLVFDRTRYFIHKDLTQYNDEDDDDENASPIGSLLDSDHNVTSTVDTKVYEDSYYMTFDENIYTTNSLLNKITFGTENMDPFPFSMFNIHTNDSNLHNFEVSLSTKVEGNTVVSKYKEITLRKMPVKIQNFLRSASVQLYKSLSMYDYMRSCYLNFIPKEQNNHFSILLNINLLKLLENVDIVNTRTTVDENILQNKSRTILKRQKSCKSLQDMSLGKTPPLVEPEQQSIFEGESVFSEQLVTKSATADPYRALDILLGYSQKVHDLENLDDDDDEDSYFVYLIFNNDLDDNMLNNILLSFIKFNHRMRRAFLAFNFSSNGLGLWKSHKEMILRDREFLNYDSINEDPTFFNTVNDYQIQLMYDYDHVLSVVYFTMCFSALFIAGINLGIIYGLLKLQKDNAELNVINNPLVVVALVFGYLFSLVFSMASINLNFQRFHSTPPVHSGIIWSCFFMVTATVIWTVIVITS